MNTGPYSDEKVQRFVHERFIPVRSRCFWDNPTPLMQKYGIKRHPEAGAVPETIFLKGVAEYKHTHDAKALRRAYDTLKAKYPQTEWARRADPYSAIPL